jgi:hypothetical protein
LRLRSSWTTRRIGGTGGATSTAAFSRDAPRRGQASA